jgi:hypothetical protein
MVLWTITLFLALEVVTGQIIETIRQILAAPFPRPLINPT